MAETAKTIEEAVTKAAEEQGVTEDKEQSGAAGDNTKELLAKTESEDKTEDKEEDKTSGLDEETQQALTFWNNLKGPNGIKYVERLAIQAGLLTAETRSEKREVIKSTMDELLENTPEEYRDLVKALGPAISKVVEGQVGKAKQEIHQVLAQQQAQVFQEEYTKFMEDSKMTDDEANELSRLTDLYPPNPNKQVPLKTYLSPLLKLVRSEAGERKSLKDTKLKQKANLAARGGNIQGDASDENLTQNKKAKTPREAVEMAMADLAKMK